MQTQWQVEASVKMSAFITEKFPASKIMFSGSVLNPSELDIYSDVDMQINMPDNTPVCVKDFLDAAAKIFSPVLGFEVISHSLKDAIRVCFENGMRFDLVFRYPCEKPIESSALKNTVENIANQF
ncbi:MAG: hypothetical protein FWC70_02325 [Defluviitaleaceae bacterium]|nr:hypothetical protein [Defluviitaleaceae bacterium]